MALSPEEELELLELEEEEYQANLAKQPSLEQKMADANAQDLALQEAEGARLAKAGLAGAAQGSTYGFSDELGAGLDVAGEVISGRQGLDGLSTKWRELQKTREAANKALKEESPYAYSAGEVAGGLANFVVTPGIGAAGVAARGGKLFGPATEALLAGKTASGSANVLGKGLNWGVQGIVPGAVYGTGASEADLSKPLELAQDAASGTIMGFIGGAGIGAATQGTKEVFGAGKELIKNTPSFQEAKAAYGIGQEIGTNLETSLSTRAALDARAKGVSRDIVEQIVKSRDNVGTAIGKAINSATESGVKISVERPFLEKSINILKFLNTNPTLRNNFDAKTNNIIKKITESKINELTPVEAFNLEKSLEEAAADLSTESLPGVKVIIQEIEGLGKNVGELLENKVSNLKELKEMFYKFNEMVPEVVMEKGADTAARKKFYSDYKYPVADLTEKLQGTLKYGKLSGTEAEKSRNTLEMLQENLKILKKERPDLLNVAKFNADDVLKKTEEQAWIEAARIQSGGSEPAKRPDFLTRTYEGTSQFLTGSKSPTVGLANRLGAFMRKNPNAPTPIKNAFNEIGQTAKTRLSETGLTDIVSNPANTMKRVFTADDSQLMTLAQSLRQSKAWSAVGEKLEDAIRNKNDGAKKAVLIKLMSIPEYREMLSGFYGKESDESNE